MGVLLPPQVAVVAVDCWYLQGMCRKSSQGSVFPVIIGHTAGQEMFYLQGLREDELVGVLHCVGFEPV